MKFPPVDQQHCGNCRYSRGGGEPTGRCHRHAPQIGPRGSEWPIVAGGDWCGEWAAMDQVAPTPSPDRQALQDCYRQAHDAWVAARGDDVDAKRQAKDNALYDCLMAGFDPLSRRI